MRSNEKPCVCNVFATPHSKNPVKSSFLSYLNVNFSYVRDKQSFANRKDMENPQTDFVCGFFCETDYDILILNRKRMEELSSARNFIVLRNTSYNVL